MTAEERIVQLEMELARERAKTARVKAELAAKAKIWLEMAIFPTYAKCPDAARTSSQSQTATAHHAGRKRLA